MLNLVQPCSIITPRLCLWIREDQVYACLIHCWTQNYFDTLFAKQHFEIRRLFFILTIEQNSCVEWFSLRWNKRRWISIKIILPELNFLTCRSSRKTCSFYYFQAGNEIFRLCLDKNMFQLSSSDIEDDRFNLDILNECHSLLQIQRSSIWLNNVHLSRIIKMSRWILEYEDTLPYVTNIVCTLWDDRRVELELLNSWFTMKLSVTMSPNVF